MKKMDICKFAGNFKKCIKEFNQTHNITFNEAFKQGCENGMIALNDYNIIYRYTSGKKIPSFETLVELADLLGITPDELLY